MKRELDTADRKIVELLQEDARLPLKSIADKVSLTSPTVSARIDRLEKDGVITGYRASVNPEVFDYRIKAFINLEVEPVRKKEFYLSVHHRLPECDRVQLRDRRLFDADGGCVPHNI